jgi:hypothetical protein
LKLLTTDQQNELLDLMGKVSASDYETTNQIAYWLTELKPKRVRKKTEKELAGFSPEHII